MSRLKYDYETVSTLLDFESIEQPISIDYAIEYEDVSLELQCLNGIRGFSSIIVFMGHLFLFWIPIADTGARWVTFGIEFLSPVSMFFIISGFTLVHVYDSPAAIEPLISWNQKKVFFWRRVARIAPLYYFSLILAIAPFIVYNDRKDIIYGTLFTGTMMQSVSAVVGNEWNPPLWSVSAFVFCYAMFPWVSQFMRHQSMKGLVALILLVYGISVGFTALFLSIYELKHIVFLHSFVLFRIPQFLVGMAAYYIGRRSKILFPAFWTELCSILMVGNLIACSLFTEWVHGDHRQYLFYCLMAEVTMPMIQAVWILTLTQPKCNTLTKRILSSSVAQFLGTMSFSFYATHWPIIVWIAWAMKGEISADAVPYHYKMAWWAFSPQAIPFIFVVCMTFAWLLHHLIERPARQYLNRYNY